MAICLIEVKSRNHKTSIIGRIEFARLRDNAPEESATRLRMQK